MDGYAGNGGRRDVGRDICLCTGHGGGKWLLILPNGTGLYDRIFCHRLCAHSAILPHEFGLYLWLPGGAFWHRGVQDRGMVLLYLQAFGSLSQTIPYLRSATTTAL